MSLMKKLATGFLTLGAMASVGFGKINDERLARWVDNAIQKDVAEYELYGDYKPDNIQFLFRKLGVHFEDMVEAYSKLAPILVSDVYSFEDSLSDLKRIHDSEIIRRKIHRSLRERMVYINASSHLALYDYEYDRIMKMEDHRFYDERSLVRQLHDAFSIIEENINCFEYFLKKGFYEFVKEVETYEKPYSDYSPQLNRVIADSFGRVEGYLNSVYGEKSYLQTFKEYTQRLIGFLKERREYFKTVRNLEMLVGKNQELIKRYEEIIKKYDSMIPSFESLVSRAEKNIRILENLPKSFPNVKFYIEKYRKKAEELAKNITVPKVTFLEEMEQHKNKILQLEVMRQNEYYDFIRIGYTSKKIIPSIYINFQPIESRGFYIDGKIPLSDGYQKELFFRLGLGKMSKSEIIIYTNSGKEYLRIQPAGLDLADILNYLTTELSLVSYMNNNDSSYYLKLKGEFYGWPTKDREGFSFRALEVITGLKFYELDFRMRGAFELADLPLLHNELKPLYDERRIHAELITRYFIDTYSVHGGIFIRSYSFGDPILRGDPSLNKILFGKEDVDTQKFGYGLILGGDYNLNDLIIKGQLVLGKVVDEKRSKTLDIRELSLGLIKNNFYLSSEFDLNSGQIKSINVGLKF